MPAGGTAALDLLRRRGIEHRVHEYEIPDSTRTGGTGSPHYGDDAARALGVDPSRIHKTLVASVDGRFVVAIVAVSADLDLKALAAAAGGRRATMADPADAERITGQVRGGISPLGQRRRLPTLIDAAVLGWPTVYVSAGRRGLQVELTPSDLVSLTSATVARISRAA
jgi:Cys-tRNA(Pro)/Cys-tRNA(Cys) deacylase